LLTFSEASAADVLSPIARLPNKSSAADPLTVPLMKAVAVELAPFFDDSFQPVNGIRSFPILV